MCQNSEEKTKIKMQCINKKERRLRVEDYGDFTFTFDSTTHPFLF